MRVATRGQRIKSLKNPRPTSTIILKKINFLCVSLGDIGGQVGLFLGASILTVLEFGDLLARIIVNKIKRNQRRHARTVWLDHFLVWLTKVRKQFRSTKWPSSLRFLIFTKLYVRLGKNATKSSFDNQLDQLDGLRTGNAVKRRFPKRVLVSALITQGERKTSGRKGSEEPPWGYYSKARRSSLQCRGLIRASKHYNWASNRLIDPPCFLWR